MNPEKEIDPARQVWEHGWDAHEQQQLQRLARLSLPQKLAWLEEAHRLVRQMASGQRTQLQSKR